MRSRNREYLIWHKMVRSCYDKMEPKYKIFGALGVTICERWRLSYENFVADMGPISPFHTRISRIDESAPFQPGNCRWDYANRGAPRGSTKGVPRPRPAFDWQSMHKTTVYLDKKLVEKIVDEADQQSTSEHRRVRASTLIRWAIEEKFGFEKSDCSDECT